MPEMSGFEATAAIRKREIQTGHHIPIVAMTAHVMKGDRERCLLAGMDHYIPKPIQARQLYEVINQLSRRGREEMAASVFPAADRARTGEPETLVDLDTALERFGGDRQLLESVLELFLEECPSRIAHLRTAVLQRDAKSLEFASHTLRGLIGNFGAATACELALKLELMAREGNLVESEAVTMALEAELKRVVATVTSLVSEHREENVAFVA